MDYQDYLQTDHWKEVSKAVKAKAGYKCQVCNSPHDLQAHHRTYEHRGSELQHLADLVCLCRRCHSVFHGKSQIEAPTIPEPQPEAKSPVMAQKPCYDHEADLPPGDSITITPENWQKLHTMTGGMTNATMIALGVRLPPIRGWREPLFDKVVPRMVYLDALRGREVLAKQKKFKKRYKMSNKKRFAASK